MNDVDGRVLFWAIWGVGTVVVYGMIFARRLGTFRRHRDPRSRREAIESFGYFLVSLAAFLGITVAIYIPFSGWAALLFAISSAVFFVVGLYTVLESEPSNGNTAARRQ